ncbi:D-hexose-6-phosphate mutarotase [Vibrio sp. UCD-FRSSP16_10]|uniref:D-hexose-6-phosphate mutarotase n=1 Tax=unclassified Vibrio TaxID=2614977 RepID=UPI0007FE6332|nr:MULTISPECIES: D-hexose-6-phosphate mutarotase [unclassified Vibrio]OBT15901.1 D-hexose-6-phosphate mutarotase [Vibrio sp. UCD-FRSSP16_10]OBT17795.1 D-hexose-6-phosphate mutarotase [Vibrio sp. UCD-FRSSP16_30]
MDVYQLPPVAVLSDNVTIAQLDQLKIVRVIHEKASAAIALHGGHVISFQPKDQADLIWMSKQAILDGKAALRGGIPVCWPWFGRVAAPAHGFARTAQWELLEHRENTNGVIISLGLKSSDETLAIWPHQFAAVLNIEVGDELKVSLVMTNTDSESWRFSAALHTYLNISDIEAVNVQGMGTEYIDGLNDAALTTGSDTLTVTEPVDRIYTQPKPLITLTDPGFERKLIVENQGVNSSVIWNPWSQGAQSMSDMPDDGYKTMLCVEASHHAPNIESGTVVEPGASYTLSSTIGSK